MHSNILYLCVWLILPILPAYLFFKVIPSTANVAGPFKGLELKLGGAFAGWFLIFLVLYSKMCSLICKDDVYEVWSIRGKIFNAQTNKPISNDYNPEVVLYPPLAIRDGFFKFNIIGNRKNQAVDFPRIQINADEYSSMTLKDLSFLTRKDSIDGWNIDFEHKCATLKDFYMYKDQTKIIKDSNTISHVILEQ